MHRKDFLKLGSLLSASTVGIPFISSKTPFQLKFGDKQTDFLYDGLVLTPKEYASLLMQMADEGKIKEDFYSNGGVVEELENKFATFFGKESAVFMPTGTLANHIALRKLAGENRRVIVQEQSHIYNDCGDMAQTLSNLNLIPLGNNAVSFTLDEILEIEKETKRGRVESRIGVIAIETPVRRQYDWMLPMNTIQLICNHARTNGYKTHLDGARIFVQCVHTNNSPTEYGAEFDTVYTSLWKGFNAPSGAILAGTKAFTEKLFHERRMFGGGLPAAWPFAAIALHYADSFLVDYKKAMTTAETLFAFLEKTGKFTWIRHDNSSHIYELHSSLKDLNKFKDSLAKNNIIFPNPDASVFMLKVNTSLNRFSIWELEDIFVKAMKDAE